MHGFLHELGRSETLQTALVCSLLAGVASGVVGSYVVVRRIASIAGSIAHCVLCGLAFAAYLAVVHKVRMYHPILGWVPLDPLVGALVAAVLAALIIGWITIRARQREDTVINAVWAIGVAIGLFFIDRTPGFRGDLMTYLFGNTLLSTSNDAWMLLALDVLVLCVALLGYPKLLAVCFDEEFARLRGINVEFWYMLLLCLTAVTVVLLMTIAGMVLVIALLTLPVAIAANFAKSLWQLMLGSVALSAIITTAGLWISYDYSAPTGATTILIAGAGYLGSMLFVRFARRNAKTALASP